MIHITIRQRLQDASKHITVAVMSSVLVGVQFTAFVHVQHAQAATPDSVFTIAQVPDTQNEVLSNTNPLLTDRYNWLVANKDALNLKFIAHTGDVVNWGHLDPAQFTRANAATNILDASNIPYGYAIGNHDTAAVDVGGSAAPGNVHDNLRNTTAFNATFPVSRLKNVGGVFEAGKVDNYWQTITAGNAEWLILTHEMWPRQAVVDWMKQVVADHPQHNVIINTHAYIDQLGNLPTDGNYGDLNAQQVWTQLYSQYPNIKFVMSGHYGPTVGNGTSYTERTGVNGNKVAEIMTAYHSDYQNHVRLLSIDTAAQTISSSVYVSSSINPLYPTGYVTDVNSSFTTTGMNWIQTGTPQVTAPTPPQGPTAIAGNTSAAVSFGQPLSNGGSPITSYTVTAQPGGLTANGTSSPITINGLTNGTSYTFTVTATNAVGTSPASVASNAVVPANISAELLSDAGFEKSNGGWAPFIVGNLATSSVDFRSGTKSLSVTAPSDAVTYVGMTQNSVVQNSVAGRQYTAQCYVKPAISGRSVRIRMLEYTQDYSSFVTVGQTTVTNIGANGWTLVSATGTAAASGMRIIPQIFSTNQITSSGAVLYDDCSVTYTLNGPAPTAPGLPTAVSATAGNQQATVSFSAPASNGGSPITSYTVTAQPGGLTANGTSSPITINGLTNGTSYTFTVTATNAVGTSPASVASNAVVPANPNPELLSDPGFENGAGTWTPFNVGTFASVTNPVYDGSKSLSISTSTTNTQLVGMTNNSVVTNSVGGKTYTFKCYIRPTVAGRNMTIRIVEYAQDYSSNVKIGTQNYANVVANAWNLVTVSGVATASGKRIIPQIYSTNQTASTGSVSYDACSLIAQ